MKDIIPVKIKPINPEAVNTVNARDLHTFLQVPTAFKDWIVRRIEEYAFTEDTDFCSFLSESTGGRPRTEYAITLDMAKELAMVERTDKGREARKYFIECEKQLINTLPTDYPSALRALANTAEQNQKLLLENKALEHKKNLIGLEACKSVLGASINQVTNKTGDYYHWRPLQKWCDENQIEPTLVKLNGYEAFLVNVYPYQAWFDVYRIDLNLLF